MAFLMVVMLSAGLSGLSGAALNRWWGGLLVPPSALTVLVIAAVRSDTGFLPGIFFLPVVLAMAAPGLLLGAALATGGLLEGRMPGKPTLTPESRKAALLWGFGCSAAGAVALLLQPW